jgi:hypothetical protein
VQGYFCKSAGLAIKEWRCFSNFVPEQLQYEKKSVNPRTVQYLCHCLNRLSNGAYGLEKRKKKKSLEKKIKRSL